MKARLFAAALAFLSVSFSQAAVQSTFYVSPNGTGDFSQANPGSLSGIQAKVRTVNANMTGDIVVYLKGGTYVLASPMNFGPSDGGTGTNYVCYWNAPGERPIISGGKQVTNWTVSSGNVWKASLPGVNQKIRNMFVDGVRAYMARGPRVRARGGWGSVPGIEGNVYDGLKFKPTELGIYANPSLIEVRDFNYGASCEATYNVRDMVSDGGYTVCKMAQPTFAIAQQQEQWAVVYADTIAWNSNPNPDSWNWWDSTVAVYDFFNAKEFLDAPGEFYYDVPTTTLYYIPRSGENLNTVDVQVALSEGFMNIQGTDLSHRVSNMQFWGITFEYAGWSMYKYGSGADTSRGYCTHDFTIVNYQPLPQYWKPGVDQQTKVTESYIRYSNEGVAPASINVESAQNIDFMWNVIKHTGLLGISLKNDASNCRIIGNLTYDLGGGSVNVGHPQHNYIGDSSSQYKQEYGPTREGACKNNLVQNNLCRDNAKIFRGQTEITGYQVEAMDISHNEIYNCPYSGIDLGWGWGYVGGDISGYDPLCTVSKNNKINYNRIGNVKLVLQDGGSIYVNGSQPGLEIVENYCYGNDAAGLYLDAACGLPVPFLVKNNIPTYDWSDNCINGVNDGKSLQAIKDSSGLQLCYKSIGSEPIAPLPGDVTCTPVALTQPIFSMTASVKPIVTKVRMYNLQGRLIATSDRMPGALRAGMRPMSAGIVIVKKEFSAGSNDRAALAVVK